MSDQQLVLVTGATGFVAQWIIKELLGQGYRVRTTLRSESRKSMFDNVFKDQISSGQLTFFVIPDLSVPGALAEPLKGVDLFFNVASMFMLAHVDDMKKDLVDPSIEITKNAYQAAVDAGVKRIVFTGSMACVLDPEYGYARDYTYTDKDYNMLSYDKAVSSDVYTAYCGAKALAEQAVWKLHQEANNSQTQVVFLHMPWIMGPSLVPYKSRDEVRQSASVISSVVLDNQVMPDAYTAFMDPRDVARAHVIAATHKNAANKRFLISGGEFLMHNVVSILNEKFGLEAPVPDVPEKYWKIDASPAERELGFKPDVDLEKALTDLGQQLMPFR